MRLLLYEVAFQGFAIRVMWESLRMCNRRVPDIQLSGCRYTIPAGTGMWTPLMALHNTTANWGKDANVYRPARWLEPGADYLPFACSTGSTQQTSSGSSAEAGHQRSAAATDSNAVNGTDGSKARSYELNVSRTQVFRSCALHLCSNIAFVS